MSTPNGLTAAMMKAGLDDKAVYERLRRFAFTLTRKDSEADDVAQEAWLRATQRFNAGHTAPSDLTAFLCGFAKNVARERHRKSSRMGELPVHVRDQTPSIESKLLRNQMDELVSISEKIMLSPIELHIWQLYHDPTTPKSDVLRLSQKPSLDALRFAISKQKTKIRQCLDYCIEHGLTQEEQSSLSMVPDPAEVTLLRKKVLAWAESKMRKALKSEETDESSL